MTATQKAAREAPGAMIASVFEQYQRPIFAYLARLADDREWAEELARATLLTALKAGDQLPGIADRRAWLYRIASDTAFRALGRRRRVAWLLPKRAHGANLSQAREDEVVANRDAAERGLTALPPEHRAPLLLYSHCGLTVAELAKALAISESAAKARLYQARLLFREAYEREVRNARPR